MMPIFFPLDIFFLGALGAGASKTGAEAAGASETGASNTGGVKATVSSMEVSTGVAGAPEVTGVRGSGRGV